MCTVIKPEQLGHPKISKRDRKVYKIGILNRRNNTFTPTFRSTFVYKLDELVTTKFTYCDNTDRINNTHLDEIEGKFRHSIINPQFVIHGFHAFSTLKRATDYSNKNDEYVIVEFVIPKGAEYYLNPAHCIVSNQIIYKGIVKN